MPKTKTTTKKNEVSAGITIPVVSLDGKEVRTIEAPKAIFAQVPNRTLLSLAVRIHLINRRQGTASTKTRSEVVGSTRKIYRQKGTGKARHGDIKAPVFVGGGIVGGPKPRQFEAKMNKKQVKQALFSALSLKKEAVAVLDNEFSSMEPKTKSFRSFLSKAGYGTDSVLLALPKDGGEKLALCIRNIPSADYITADRLNAYDVLYHKRILFTETAFNELVSKFSK